MLTDDKSDLRRHAEVLAGKLIPGEHNFRHCADEVPRRNKMIALAIRILLLAALLAPPLAAAGDATGNSDSTAVPTQHNEATVAQLQAEMASGKLTSEE